MSVCRIDRPCVRLSALGACVRGDGLVDVCRLHRGRASGPASRFLPHHCAPEIDRALEASFVVVV